MNQIQAMKKQRSNQGTWILKGVTKRVCICHEDQLTQVHSIEFNPNKSVPNLDNKAYNIIQPRKFKMEEVVAMATILKPHNLTQKKAALCPHYTRRTHPLM